jgi:hypothetical protein
MLQKIHSSPAASFLYGPDLTIGYGNEFDDDSDDIDQSV